MTESIVTVEPTEEPVSLNDVVKHLRLFDGAQEPVPGAPVAALAGAGAGSVNNGAHSYVVTFVTLDGETSAGTPSSTVTVADSTTNGKVALTGIPIGSSAVVARKLYRTAAAGSTYLLLATIADNTTTTYTDNIADASLGAQAPSVNSTGASLLTTLITMARVSAETICRIAMVTQTRKFALDEFPRPAMNIASANWYGPQWGTNPGPLSVARVDGTNGYEIYIPRPPLQSISSVMYYDTDGVQQTLAADQYLVDTYSKPARVMPAPNVTWPATQTRPNAVEIIYVCGYGAAAAVPAGLKQWMLMRIGAAYENREEIVVGSRLVSIDLPFVDALLDEFRVVRY